MTCSEKNFKFSFYFKQEKIVIYGDTKAEHVSGSIT